MSHITSRILVAVAALIPALLLAPVSTSAETGPEEGQGAQLQQSEMGSSDEVQMHEYMGRRASGCGGGAVPSGFGRMMGMMGTMGGHQGAGRAGAGMMHGQSGTGGGSHGGSMMGGNPVAARDSDDDGPSAGVMIGLMAVLVAAMAIALLILKPWRQSGSSLDLLDRRFASGDLDAEDYQQRKQLLKGG